MKNLAIGLLLLNQLLITVSFASESEKLTQSPNKVVEAHVTTLSTMLANRGIGEWGYSALITVDGQKILFDTGNRPDTVLNNAKALNIDLSTVEHVILSHNHGDHTGGLLNLRNSLKSKNPKAMSKIHVGKGIFAKRSGRENSMLEMKNKLQLDGVEFIEYENASEIFPGVWLTGNVTRKTHEKNYNTRGKVHSHDGVVEDIVSEDLSLAIHSENGFILISGCGHAGIVNTMQHIIDDIHDAPIDAAIGGFHLLNADSTQLAWTASKLEEFGVTKMLGAHCTGINALYDLRALLDGNRKTFVVGAVGDHFDTKRGITPATIAK